MEIERKKHLVIDVELNLNKNSIGIIGFGNQAKRIIDVLRVKKIKINTIFVKNYKNSYKKNKLITSDFKKLKDNKIIFICSPNNSHYHYLKLLYKNRYIFCEKPPASSKEQINKLKRINHSKIYYNFNFRFSTLAIMLNKSKDYKLGKLLYGNISWSHGLASKKKFFTSWRNNKRKTPKGILEVLTIHFIDLINMFMLIKKISIDLKKMKNKNSSFVTSYTNITLKNNSKINIFNSYNAPREDLKHFIFENGSILENEEEITISGPRDNFDKNGFFIKPKILKTIKYKKNFSSYEESLKKSIIFFLEVSTGGNKFYKKLSEKSFSSNEIILGSSSLIKSIDL